jgi:hypothetical protein
MRDLIKWNLGGKLGNRKNQEMEDLNVEMTGRKAWP